MMGLKFITIVLLIAAASPSQATPAPSPSDSDGLVGDILGGVIDLVGNLLGGWKGDKSGIIKILTKFLNGILKIIPKTVDQLLKLLAELICFIEKAVNILVPKLGTALAKVIYGVLQYIFCLLGSSGLPDLFGGKWGTPKMCKTGLYPHGGLDGDCDEKECKKIIGEGCDEGTEIWGGLTVDISGLGGYLQVLLTALLNGFNHGKKCRDDDYKIDIDDLLYFLIHVLFPVYTGACENYGIVGGLLAYVEKLLKAVFGSYKYDFDHVKSETAKCRGGKSLHDLPQCFKKGD